MKDLIHFIESEVINFSAKDRPNMSWVKTLTAKNLNTLKQLTDKALLEIQRTNSRKSGE